MVDEQRPSRPLGALFPKRPTADLSAAEYRALVREHAERSLLAEHGPTGDRHAAVAQAYALCALSVTIEGTSGG